MQKVVLLLVFFVIFAFSQENASYDIVKLGDKIPISQLTLLDGTNVSLENKIVWITFFATWCSPCKAELPELTRVWQSYKKYPDFVLIVVGREETKETIEDFAQKNNLSLLFAADPTREIYDTFALGYIPRNYLISRDGKIIASTIGYDKKEKLKNLVEHVRQALRLLEKGKPEESGKPEK